jgi:hypothetical protein
LLHKIRLGGVMVGVLAIGPKVPGFKRCRGDGFLKVIQIYSTISFGGGGEVKTTGPSRKILRDVKYHFKV